MRLLYNKKFCNEIAFMEIYLLKWIYNLEGSYEKDFSGINVRGSAWRFAGVRRRT